MRARGLAADQAVRPPLVQLEHPIPHDLQRHTADRRSLRPRGPVVDRRQGQQPPGLPRIMAPPGNSTQRSSIVISPQRNRHGSNPAVYRTESDHARVGQDSESASMSLGISHSGQQWLGRRLAIRVGFQAYRRVFMTTHEHGHERLVTGKIFYTGCQ